MRFDSIALCVAAEDSDDHRRAHPLFVVFLVGIVVEFGQNLSRVTVAAGGEPSKLLHVTLFGGEFNELVRCVPAAAGGEASKLVHVTLFGGEFNEVVRCVPAAAVSETTQLFKIPSLSRKFDQFPDCIEVTVGGLFPQS